MLFWQESTQLRGLRFLDYKGNVLLEINYAEKKFSMKRIDKDTTAEKEFTLEEGEKLIGFKSSQNGIL